ncbi:MAG: EAL domain-containing protein [Candidatus Competibacter sp.]|nr:EAL domain-containing protein [Candidatus Competibacter sp.]MDG4585671.1 EAL domain-containing protein [Candidatus Competibacter sp.]
MESSLRVLYVEDAETDAELARRALTHLTPRCVLDVAASLQDGLERLSAAPTGYDLVLTDLRLPDGNGLDLLTHVRERGLPLAVVILTGSGDQESVIAALKAGADDYLVKTGDYLERLPKTLAAALIRFRNEVARRTRPLRVLYAEHNAFDLDLTRRHLAQYAAFIRLDTAHNTDEVLACLPDTGAEAPPYDVLLLDYHLPGSDALEAVKRLRQERGLDLPVVLVTGQGSEEAAAQALRLGVADYLVKRPGYLFELPATLEKAHHRAELLREQAALRDSNRRYDELTARIAVGVYRFRMVGDGEARFDYVSARWCAMNDLKRDQVLADARLAFELVHPEEREGFRRLNERVRSTLETFAWEGRFLIRGETRWMRVESSPTRQENGDIVWDGVQADMTERRLAEEKLRQAVAVIASTRDGMIVTDLKPRIVTVNPAYTEITGYTEAEVLGKNPRLLQSGRHDRTFYQAMWASILETGHWQGELWNRRKSGELYPQWLTISTVRDERGEATHYVGVLTDISQIKRAEEQLEHLAHHDPLTDLPNRRLAQSRLAHAVEQAQRHERRVGVLLLDLDRFKTVNDSLGHPAGDALLRAIALRLRKRLREEDTLARLGGDEFLVVLEHLPRPEEAASVAQNLLDLLTQPFMLPDGSEVYVNASIGVSLYPDDGGSAADLIQHADAAVYQAKEQGRNTYRFYTEALTRIAHERLDLERRMRGALERGEFLLHYQPQLSVTEGRIVGVEALVRWQPPGQALVSPARFIPLAEETGLIVPLGEWVLRTACAQAQAWRAAGWPSLLMAVNLSARQIRQPDLVGRVRAALADSGLPAECLELEITESGLMEQGEQAETILRALKETGARLAIDDFGTGYSSLAYLKRFPIDQLKIDQSFVRDIPHDPNDMEIAAAIIALAHTLRLEVLAEGVETTEQLAFLREHGCNLCQGYLFSRPVPPEDLALLLAAPPAVK